jgi:hypothetical protein
VEPPAGVESEIDKEVERIFRREIDSGKIIDVPANYKAGIRKRVGAKIEQEVRTNTVAAAGQREIDACKLCTGDGTVLLETDGGDTFGERCTHNRADYKGLRISTEQT